MKTNKLIELGENYITKNIISNLKITDIDNSGSLILDFNNKTIGLLNISDHILNIYLFTDVYQYSMYFCDADFIIAVLIKLYSFAKNSGCFLLNINEGKITLSLNET